MKKSLVFATLFIVIILAVTTTFKPVLSSQIGTESNNASVSAQDETGEMLINAQSGAKHVPVICTDYKVAPMFDTTGAIVSDPTGTILSTHRSACIVVAVTGLVFKVAPVFDTTGAIVSDPTGTILSLINEPSIQR